MITFRSQLNLSKDVQWHLDQLKINNPKFNVFLMKLVAWCHPKLRNRPMMLHIVINLMIKTWNLHACGFSPPIFLNYGTKIIQLHLFLGNLANREEIWITSHRQVLRDSFYIFGWSGGGKKNCSTNDLSSIIIVILAKNPKVWVWDSEAWMAHPKP